MVQSNKSLTIAFTDISSSHWTAGRQYLKNLFHALSCLGKGCQPEIVLVTDGSGIHADLAPYVSRSITLPSPGESAPPSFPKRVIQKIQRKLGGSRGQEAGLSVKLREAGVDCLFTINDVEDRFKVPVMVWIPDFQHVSLPWMFSPGEIEHRNQTFRRAAEKGDLVILSSRDALGDYSQFAPDFAGKGRVLSFCTRIPDEVFSRSPEYVCERYHLPRQFVFLPNQFWKHKNHEVVIKAIQLARAVNPDITVVCTGNTNDYRNPHYMGGLLAEISQAGVRDNLIILGLVDRDDLYQLMRQSLALLQPSLFEGWSTTVEEVKALGKRIIVSDIQVHREQAPLQAAFFDPQRPEQLAECLHEVFRNTDDEFSQEMESAARLRVHENTVRFAQTFMEIAAEVCAAPPVVP